MTKGTFAESYNATFLQVNSVLKGVDQCGQLISGSMLLDGLLKE